LIDLPIIQSRIDTFLRNRAGEARESRMIVINYALFIPPSGFFYGGDVSPRFLARRLLNGVSRLKTVGEIGLTIGFTIGLARRGDAGGDAGGSKRSPDRNARNFAQATGLKRNICASICTSHDRQLAEGEGEGAAGHRRRRRTLARKSGYARLGACTINH